MALFTYIRSLHCIFPCKPPSRHFRVRLNVPSLHHDGLGISTSIKTAATLHNCNETFILVPRQSDVELNVELPRAENAHSSSKCCLTPCQTRDYGPLLMRSHAQVVRLLTAPAVLENVVVTPIEAYRYNAAIGPDSLTRPGPPPASAIKPGRFIGGELSLYAELVAAKS